MLRGKSMKEIMEIILNEVVNIYSVETNIAIMLIVVMIVVVYMHVYTKKKEDLWKILNHDPLTGLITEYKFLEDGKEILKTVKEDEEYLVVSIDIDNFKYINEVYGYEIGTEAIKLLANSLTKRFPSALLIAHVFADSFLLLTKCANANHTICDKTQCVNCRAYLFKDLLGEEYQLNTSVGIYRIRDKKKSLSYMIDCANFARLKGKSTYGHTHMEFTSELEEELKSKNSIVSAMEHAIKTREFKMVYQPKIDFRTMKMIGAEALVRWVKADGTIVFPDYFIPVFEKNGFITRLDYYVFDEVCHFLKSHEEVPVVSINLSGITLLEDGLVKRIMGILELHNIAVDRIEIEITESAIVDNFQVAIMRIEELKEHGIIVSMDDFGTGVSSLNRLKDISVDVLKIDKEFLSNTLNSKRGNIIIESVINMSKKLGLVTVAEGVETQEQAEILMNFGCDIAQGYYYAKPLEVDDFLEYTLHNS